MDIEKRLFDFITNFDPYHEGYTESESDQIKEIAASVATPEGRAGIIDYLSDISGEYEKEAQELIIALMSMLPSVLVPLSSPKNGRRAFPCGNFAKSSPVIGVS